MASISRTNGSLTRAPVRDGKRAREIPLGGDSAPRPLRTPEHPEGRPDLDPAIWKFCLEHDIVVVIENPYRSLFWHLPEISSILQDDRAVLVRSDFCMFGGMRLKKTALLSNNHLIHALAVHQFVLQDFCSCADKAPARTWVEGRERRSELPRARTSSSQGIDNQGTYQESSVLQDAARTQADPAVEPVDFSER